MWPGKDKTLKISRELAERAAELGEKRGYATLEEFVEHLLNQELEKEQGDDTEKKDLKSRLKGLGYL